MKQKGQYLDTLSLKNINVLALFCLGQGVEDSFSFFDGHGFLNWDGGAKEDAADPSSRNEMVNGGDPN